MSCRIGPWIRIRILHEDGHVVACSDVISRGHGDEGLVERAAPSEQVDATKAVDRLTRMLDEIGFEPEVRATKKGIDVVCAIHLGLMQAAP